MLRMTRTSTAFVILLFFLLHTTSGESGSTSEDESDDELENMDIECFSQLEIKEDCHSLTCNVTELDLNNTNVNFTVCSTIIEKRICATMEKQEGTYFLYFYGILSPKDICVVLESNRPYCRSVEVTHIVKPETPFGINITFRKDANEYFIRYKTPHSKKKYLKDKLIHETAYRQENGTWETIQSPYLWVKLLGKSLQMGASYEVKVRSKPNGKYFKGIWSEWSSSEYFQMEAEHPRKKSIDMVVVITTVGFILLFVPLVLILTFWKTRIKPVLWPNLPDHKKTLEQLCKKPKKNFDTSFNPESFGYVHIHKVDGIQAKAEVECFLQPSAPLDADVSEKVCNGSSEMKTSLAAVDKSVLKLPVTYGGIWPSDTLSGHLCETHPSMLDGSSNDIPYKVCSSNGTQLYNCGPMTHSSSSADPMVQPRSGPLNINTMSLIQPNNGVKSSNKDEAYVTMSSFCKNQ
ncbi:interleukin-7 receptor subunit alpha [Chelonoidis abingdonii]|uniref:interleukin-7 receptor subunit alpha n=1 Tax=Chelonoidis abingdonii TaxID=106734 RepID=UPI0013F274E8|nr:interleukin-7 receptor subunit alpha [Chelonoidis abingdonii]